jgi:hypothetical protein
MPAIIVLASPDALFGATVMVTMAAFSSRRRCSWDTARASSRRTITACSASGR